MAFNWITFLEQHHIEYITSGPNVSRNNVAIRCIFCGTDDQSHHLGISLEGKGWACWRRSDHRGKNPTRLVQALLGCSYEHARSICDTNTFLPDDFLGQLHKHDATEATSPSPQKPLRLLLEFKSLYDNRQLPSARMFIRYLHQRDFTTAQINGKGLQYCTRGPFKGRIIFPVRMNKRLVTWTGRTVYRNEPVRYKTLHADPQKAADAGLPVAHGPITDYLLWYDWLLKCDADTIYVVEGPFDALRISVLGKRHGIVATCLFTNNISAHQIDLLHDLLPRFRNRRVLMDENAFVNSLQIGSSLAGLGVKVCSLPPSIADPGSLLNEQQLLHIGA